MRGWPVGRSMGTGMGIGCMWVRGGCRRGWAVFDVTATQYKVTVVANRTVALWTYHPTTDNLFLINPLDPDSEVGDFGNLGQISGLTTPEGLTNLNGDLHLVDRGTNPARLYKINPADPTQTTGGYGNQGSLPSALSRTVQTGITNDGTDLWILAGTTIWKINPDNPSQTDSGYGSQGTASTGGGYSLAWMQRFIMVSGPGR